MNSDLSKTNTWANQWKMTYNPDPKKQAQDIIFLPQNKKDIAPSTEL